MKKTEAMRLAEIQAQRDLWLAVLKNPMLSLVAGVIVMEAAEKAGITGPIITTSTEVGLIGVTTAQALAPILPELTEGAASIAKVLAIAG